MNEADSQGIVVIDECPAVGLSAFDDIILKAHLKTITEMIQRDKNRPSVVMWSIANEPDVRDSGNYFATVAAHARGLDKTRLITAATAGEYSYDKMSVSLDVLMVNRYWGWYQDTGYSQTIEIFLTNNFQKWYDTHKKPLMISEYGADTVAGLHMVIIKLNLFSILSN